MPERPVIRHVVPDEVLASLEVAGSDIAGTHDEFVFAYASAGTFDLVARVDEREDTFQSIAALYPLLR
jgi:hypothetical protein